MTTTTNTTQPKRKAPKHAAQPKTKGAAAPKTRKQPSTRPANQSSGDIEAILRQVASGAGGSGLASDLRSQLEQGVWNQYVYIGSNDRYKSGRGTMMTKVRGSDLLNALTDKSKLSDTEFRQLQEKLFLGGFYGTNNRKAISWGNRFDAGTRDAYASAIASNVIANQSTTRTTRITLTDIIDTSAKFGPAATQDGTEAVFHYQPPDPVALTQAIDEAMPAIIGRRLSADETQRIVSEYQAKALSAAKSDFATTQSGGVAQPAPEFGAFVKQRARELFPVESGVVDREHAADTFLSAITGGSTQTASF